MLLQRILTAIPLAVLVVWIILFQPTRIFDGMITVVIFIAGFEWARLSGVEKLVARYSYALLIAFIPWLILQRFPAYAVWLIYAAVIWWFSLSYYLKRARPRTGITGWRPEKLFIAVIIIPAAFLAMHLVHSMPEGQWWLMYSLALVWVADIGAYFSGKRFGKNKLSPYISPGKTKEGLYGALFATTVYTLIASFLFDMMREDAILLILLSVILTIISVNGDLYISFLKREAGMKDSGHILPGHGGILDRIDSVLAAMPVFALGFHWLISPVFV